MRREKKRLWGCHEEAVSKQSQHSAEGLEPDSSTGCGKEKLLGDVPVPVPTRVTAAQALKRGVVASVPLPATAGVRDGFTLARALPLAPFSGALSICRIPPVLLGRPRSPPSCLMLFESLRRPLTEGSPRALSWQSGVAAALGIRSEGC